MNRISCTPNALAAYLYLHLGEQMPEDASDEWFLEKDSFIIDVDRVSRFIQDVQIMIDALEQETDPEQYMVHFYDAAKRTFDQDKSQIRTWFSWLYLILFQRSEGPRWGDFVQIYEVENFVEKLRVRFFEISCFAYK